MKSSTLYIACFGILAIASCGENERTRPNDTQNQRSLLNLSDRISYPFVVRYLRSRESGFIVQFSRAFDSSVLNLYDDSDPGTTVIGPADVELRRRFSGVTVNGSLQLSADLTRIEFIATGGILSPDIYDVKIRSGADAFHASNGEMLLGGDYISSFTVRARPQIVVSIPDFSRGPGQPVNLPADDEGLPITLSTGSGVTELKFILSYDKELLELMGTTIGTGLPDGSTLTVLWKQPGLIALKFKAGGQLPEGPVTFAKIIANIPTTATYGGLNIMKISRPFVNSGRLKAIGDSAAHSVVYVGDADRNRGYTVNDARLISRVIIGRDPGFLKLPLIDPTVVANVTEGPFDSSDSLIIRQYLLGLPTPQLPALP